MFRESQELKDDVWDCTLIKSMKQHNDTVVNPIYDWSAGDIWDYIQQEGIEVNPLYAQGYERIGCIGCPLAKHKERLRDFQRYPVYKKNYIKAFQTMIDTWDDRTKEKRDKLNTGEKCFEWWIESYKDGIEGQMSFEDLEVNK